MTRHAHSTYQYTREVPRLVRLRTIIIMLAIAYIAPTYLIHGELLRTDALRPRIIPGDLLLTSPALARMSVLSHGSLVTFSPYRDAPYHLAGYVVGLPGETVEIRRGRITATARDGTIKNISVGNMPAEHIYHKTILYALGDDEYFVIGHDIKRAISHNYFGVVKRSELHARIFAHTHVFNTFVTQ